jgi:hypothetical protein
VVNATWQRWLRTLFESAHRLRKSRNKRPGLARLTLRLEQLESRLVPAPLPSVLSILRTSPLGPITTAASVSYTVNFNQSVTGVAVADFRLTTDGSVHTTPALALLGSGATYTVGISGIRGNGDLRLDLIDDDSIVGGGVPLGGVGVGNGSFQGQTYSIQQVSPSVVSINRATPGGPVNSASSLSYTVTFNEAVTGVDAGDFQLALTGNVSAPLVQVLPVSGSVYTVTVSGITGSGTVGLNLVDNGTIHDLNGNPLAPPSAAQIFQGPPSAATSNDPSAVALGELNGDGRPDLVVVNTTNATVGVLLSNGNGTFIAQQTFATGKYPSSVALGDLNGDGRLDLAVANKQSNTVSILLGNGNGTFQAQSTFATGSGPFSVAVADVNGDGKLDLAVANSGSNNVGVLLGNGNGTFQAQQTFAAGNYPRSVAVGDINGDGKPDLIVVNSFGYSASVLLGNGNGTFHAQSTLATGSFPISVALSDLNGDGKLDLAVANDISGTVGVYLGNGDGTFQGQLTFASGSFSASVTVGDVNGDGIPDLLVPNGTNNTVNLLLGNGNGTFQARQAIASNSGPSGVVLSDFNGDGKPDLAVVNQASRDVSVLFGNGNGTFQTIQTTFATGSYPNWVAMGDLNGDGKPDLAVANFNSGTVSVLVGNGNGTFQAQQVFPAGPGPVVVAIGDVNGDGKPDLEFANLDGTGVSVLLGNGNATFQSPINIPTGTSPFGLAVGDVNGDGKADFVVANGGTNSLFVLLGNGNGTFQTSQTLAAGAVPAQVVLSDLNGDGKADIVVANSNSSSVSVFLGNGNGTFQAQQVFGTGTTPNTVAVGDVNGDGKPDLVVANRQGASVSVLFGNGNGTFQAQQQFATGYGPSAVVIGDLNGDGKPDLAVTLESYNCVVVLLGNGNGTFQPIQDFAVGTFPISLVLGDVNGDGKSDVAVANNKANSVSVLLAGNGDFTGQLYSTVPAFVQSINRTMPLGPVTNASSVAFTVTFSEAVAPVYASDFQLAFTGTMSATISQVRRVSGAVYTVTVNGITGTGTVGLNFVDNGTVRGLAGNALIDPGAAAEFQPQELVPIAGNPTSVTLADVNGDGNADLIATNFHSASVSVYLGNGNGTFQSPEIFGTGPSPRSVVVGDVNGDGRPDLIVSDQANATVAVLLGNGNGTFQAAQFFGVGARPQQVVLGDVNGDGRPDIAVANYSDNTVSVLLGNGNGTFQAQQVFGVGSEPRSVALGDVNGDGLTDLVVANDGPGSNSVSVLLGNGNGTFQAQEAVPAGSRPFSVLIDDLNADGKPDLVVADEATNSVSVLLGNGNGTFQAPAAFAVGVAPTHLAQADFNGDGIPDVAVATYTSAAVSVLLGNGNGTFQAQQTFTTGALDDSIATGDINGDGRPDLVVANYNSGNASVLLNAVNDNFTGPLYTNVPAFVQSISRTSPLGPVTNATSVTYTVTFSEGVTGVAAGDFALALTGTVVGTISQVTPVNGAVYTVTVTGIAGYGTLGLNLVDNASIRGFAGNSLLPANFALSLQSQVAIAISVPPDSVAVADLNGDGKPDLVSANGTNPGSVNVALGNGNGTFQGQTTFAAGAYPAAVTVMDLNGDGTPDLIVVNQSSGTVAVLMGNGNGTFQSQVTYAVGVNPVFVTSVDVNGDNKPDLVVVNSGTNNVSVLLGNGNGTFQGQTTWATGSAPTAVAALDINGDGSPDLVVANGASGTVSVLLGNGNGTFQNQATFASGANPSAVTLADLNGDGKPDLVVANQTSAAVSVLLGNGNGTFQSRTSFTVGTNPVSVVEQDINGDGNSDLVVANQGSNSLSVLLGNGNGTFQQQVTFATGLDPVAVVAADVSGDARPDLIVANQQSGNIGVFLNSANGSFAGQLYTFMQPSGATHFAVSGTPSTVLPGMQFAFTVTALNSSNATDTGYIGTVQFTSSDSQAGLPGNATLLNGAGVFQATLATGGTQTITAGDTAVPSIIGASGPITVIDVATHFAVITPSAITAGFPFVIQVTAEDSLNRAVAGYSGTVHFTASDTQAVLPGSATLTGGVGFFAAILRTAGNQTIVATDAANATLTGSSSPIAVSAAGVARFSVTNGLLSFPGVLSGPQNFAVTGTPLGFTVTALDAFGNVATTYAGVVHFTSSDGAAALPADTTLANGVGIFSATLATAGTQTLTATDSVQNSGFNAITGNSGGIVTRGLVVTSFALTPSGFTMAFDKPFDPSTVNLFTTTGLPDDVLLATTGTQVSLRGSLVFNPPTNVGGLPSGFTFVKTASVTATGIFNPSSGLLAAGKYTLTLRSFGAGSSGFQDAIGGALDGTNSGTPGNNFQITFNVSAPPVAVGIPGFARGPSNTDAVFLPSTLSSGSTFALSYTNPAANPTTGTATVTFSTTAATLQSNIQAALTSGGLAKQVGNNSAAQNTPNSVVVVTTDNAAGANVLVTFQSALATATNQLLSSSAAGVTIGLANINVANNIPGSGIPIALTSALGVTSGLFTLQYNPTLLNITGVAPSAALANIAGASFTMFSNTVAGTSGTLMLSLSSPTKLSTASTAFTLGSLLATVPLSATATYGAKQLLHFSGELLAGTAGPTTVVGVDGVQIAAYFGDVTDTGGPLSLQDAAAIAVVGSGVPNTAAQTIPGFMAFPNVDPILIGDVSLQGLVNQTDAGAMTQQVGGTARPTIPYAPIGLPVTPASPDPTSSKTTNLAVSQNNTVSLPKTIDKARPLGRMFFQPNETIQPTPAQVPQGNQQLQASPSVWSVFLVEKAFGNWDPLTLEVPDSQVFGQDGVDLDDNALAEMVRWIDALDRM